MGLRSIARWVIPASYYYSVAAIEGEVVFAELRGLRWQGLAVVEQ